MSLKESSFDPVQNPSIKLLEYWEAKYGSILKGNELRNMNEGDGYTAPDFADEDTEKCLMFEMDRTMEDLPSLRTAPNLISARYIDKFVDAWVGKWIR